MNLQDIKNAQLYVINGYIVDAFDAGKRPTKQEIMQQWQYWHGSESRQFTYVDIDWIIAKVAKYYEN